MLLRAAASRLRATRRVAKAKLSQDNSAVDTLDGRNAALARAMRMVWTPEEGA